jgi:hypothetical protein
MNEDDALKEIHDRLNLYKRMVNVLRRTIEVCRSGMKIQDETIALQKRAMVAQDETIIHLRGQVKMLREEFMSGEKPLPRFV